MRDLGRFDIILADPPWYYDGDPNKMGAAGKEYNLMTTDAIADLPLHEVIHPASIVFLWVTSPKFHEGIKLLDAWHLHFRGVQFVWVKTKKDGTPIGAQGVRPSIVKPTCEFVIAGSRKATGRPQPLSSESIVQTILAPKRQHSRKPDELYERLETMYPSQRKLELFARYPRDGWVQWGDQI